MAKVLFIRGGAVGDFILTLPAIQLVHDHLPECEIEVLGYPNIAELAVSAGLASRVKSIEHAALAPFFAPGAVLDEELCGYFSSFDLVISYLFDPDGIFQSNLTRAGVETLFCGPYRMNETHGPEHAAFQLAKPLESLALYLRDPWVELSYSQTESTELPKSCSRREIFLHPGSGSPAKNWSFESWINVLTGIAIRHPETHFNIISGEAEHEVIGEFLALLNQTACSYHHLNDRPLCELGSLVGTGDFFLGHDSGISHLAASTGIAGLVLFGPTNPKVWAPAHPNFVYLQTSNRSLAEISPLMVEERLLSAGF